MSSSPDYGVKTLERDLELALYRVVEKSHSSFKDFLLSIASKFVLKEIQIVRTYKDTTHIF
jgi:hypothetical protein